MSEASGWVLLVECHDVAELHALRAALEARGVPCQVQGEHTHGIMGAIQGAAVRSRVRVPAPALEVARALARDIVGPFDDDPATQDEEDAEDSPFRRPAELTPELAAEAEESADPQGPRLKSYARLVLVASLVVAPLLGLGHVYAGLNARAGALLLITMFSLPAALNRADWALGALAGVWIADVIGGALGIAAHNRRVRRVQAALPAGSRDAAS